MVNKTLKVVRRISKKYGIKFSFYEGENTLCKYSGFNNFFAEFIDVELVISQDSIELFISPELTFSNINKIPSCHHALVSKINDRLVYKHQIDITANIKDDLKSLFSHAFSKEILKHYFSLVIRDSRFES